MVVPRIRERGPLALAEPPAAATRYAEGVLKSGWIEAAPLAPGWWFLSACRVPLLLPKGLVSLISLGLVVSALNLCLSPIISAKLLRSDLGSGFGGMTMRMALQRT